MIAFIKLFLVICVAVVMCYNTIVWMRGNPELTLSELIRGVSTSQPIVPFLFGLLMGHWFGTNNVY